MLKHEDSQETPPRTAAQVRVTPEELADAIATLQAGKEGTAGTISIGDVVEELSLDSTPEEILETVEARREQRTHSRRKKRRGWLALGAALAAVGTAGVAFRPHTRVASVASVASPQIHSLADVKDEQQTYVDTHGLKQIIEGAMPAQVQTYPFSQGIRWGLIKHSGKVYVQAYTLQLSEKQIESKMFDLHNVEDADLTGRAPGYIVVSSGTLYPDVKVTLPIQAFRYQDSQQSENQAKITVSDVHPDNHLWDKFEHDH